MITTIGLGRRVICDSCGVEYTSSQEVGGILFQSKAVCPTCAVEFERNAERYGETNLIRDRAGPGETFVQFVERLRGGEEGKIEVRTGADALAGLAEMTAEASFRAAEEAEAAERARPAAKPARRRWPEPTVETPSDDVIEAILMDGEDCEATDGCAVEADGVCPHGHPSWLVRLGYL